MSFKKLFDIIREKINETSRVKKLTDEQLSTEQEDIKLDLKEDPTNIGLQNELQDIEIELERRRELAPKTEVKGALLAPRRLDFSKLSDEEVQKLIDLEEQNPPELLNQLKPQNGIPFQDFEWETILSDLFDEWGKRNKEVSQEPSEEEMAGIEKSWDERDRTKGEGWNFYAYDLPELEDFKAMSDEELKVELDIENDEQLKAARAELDKVIEEMKSWEEETAGAVKEIKSIRKILEVKGKKVNFKKIFGLKGKLPKKDK